MRSLELLLITSIIIATSILFVHYYMKTVKTAISGIFIPSTKEKPSVLLIIHPTDTSYKYLAKFLSVHTKVYYAVLGQYTIDDLSEYDAVIVASKYLTEHDIKVLSQFAIAGGKLVYSVLYKTPRGVTISTTYTGGTNAPSKIYTLPANTKVILRYKPFCGVLCRGIKQESTYRLHTDVMYTISTDGYVDILNEDYNLITEYFKMEKRALVFYVDYLELFKYRDLDIGKIILNFIFYK